MERAPNGTRRLVQLKVKFFHAENMQTAVCFDRQINKITFRVWTILNGKTGTFDRLVKRMLRQVESGNDVK